MCLKTGAFRNGAGTRLTDDEGRRVQHNGRDANTPTPCLSRWKSTPNGGRSDRGRTNRDRFDRSRLRYDPKVSSWMKLCTGAVELAFNHDNGDVITETDVSAEVCRAVKDIDDEFFRRK
jgi:hypothetical protein